MSKITRRETLTRGGQAMAAAAVLSALPSIAAAKEDAELFSCFEKCKQLENEYMAAINRYDETRIAVSRRFGGLPLREPPTKRMLTPGTPEHKAFLDEARAEHTLMEAAEKQRPGGLAEAEKQAGVPALKKKYDTTERAWLDALERLYDMPAYTPEGMILKLTIEWNDRIRRHWRAKGRAADVEFHPDATPSVLLDLERLAGQVS